jgi:hypothetical protein
VETIRDGAANAKSKKEYPSRLPSLNDKKTIFAP